MSAKTKPVKLVEPKCPECERMRAASSTSQAQGEFLDWLQQEKHWSLCATHRHTEECYTLGLKPKELVALHGRFMDTTEQAKGRFNSAQCRFREGQYLPVSFQMESLLAEYHGIDLKKVEKERRALLDYVRAQSNSDSARAGAKYLADRIRKKGK
jgi:hypothetical protein